jgi:hypothetical protein
LRLDDTAFASDLPAHSTPPKKIAIKPIHKNSLENSPSSIFSIPQKTKKEKPVTKNRIDHEKSFIKLILY